MVLKDVVSAKRLVAFVVPTTPSRPRYRDNLSIRYPVLLDEPVLPTRIF